MIVQILTAMVDIFMVTGSNQKEYFCREFVCHNPAQNLLMKSFFRFCLPALVLFSIFSCTKEVSQETNNKTETKQNFYCSIDGTPWNADSLELVLLNSNGASINGLSKTGEQISMVLPDFKIGTYTLSPSSVPYAVYANLLNNIANVFVSNVAQAGGTITITAIDSVNQLLTGTFQFTLTNPIDNSTKIISKGVFDHIPYTGDGGGVINPPPPGADKDTLTAVVDGSSFDAAQVEATLANSPTGGPAQLLISGIAANGTQDIALLMPASVASGTYDLDFTAGNYIGIYYPSQAVTLVSISNGTLTIISNDTVTKRIKGTFNFTATPFTSGTPANITQGYFAVSY
jgi:hypothetical protein